MGLIGVYTEAWLSCATKIKSPQHDQDVRTRGSEEEEKRRQGRCGGRLKASRWEHLVGGEQIFKKKEDQKT